MSKDYLKKIAMIIPSQNIKAKILVKYYLANGLTMGKNCHFFSTVQIAEPYLVTIGNNVTISSNVCLLTHDASIGALFNRESLSDCLGKISIGNHCFIGYGAIILYGVTIPDNTVIAAGAVVTKSPPPPSFKKRYYFRWKSS